MKIREIMVSDVIFVQPDDSILSVSEIIFRNRFHAVPVVEKDKVVGIITEDDFFLKDYDDLFLPAYIKFLKQHRAAESLPKDAQKKLEKLLSAKAKDIMTPECVTVSPQTETGELMNLIKKTKFTTFPVTDKNKNLLGIVTLADILGTVRKGSREMERAMNRKKKPGEIGKIAKEIHSTWSDNMLIISKKKVHTWQGGILITLLAVLSGIVFVVMNSQNKTACEIEQKEFLPVECQRFSYSDWESCQSDGTQKRKIIERLPRGCEGGQPEKLVRGCQ